MPELFAVPMVLLLIALLAIIIRVNRRDRKDVEVFALESQSQVQERLERLTKSEQVYKEALKGADIAKAQKLGRDYYKEKTDYEYWESAVDPYWDMENMSQDKSLKISKDIKISNSRLRKTLTAKNDRALAIDIKAMNN